MLGGSECIAIEKISAQKFYDLPPPPPTPTTGYFFFSSSSSSCFASPAVGITQFDDHILITPRELRKKKGGVEQNRILAYVGWGCSQNHNLVDHFSNLYLFAFCPFPGTLNGKAGSAARLASIRNSRLCLRQWTQTPGWVMPEKSGERIGS